MGIEEKIVQWTTYYGVKFAPYVRQDVVYQQCGHLRDKRQLLLHGDQFQTVTLQVGQLFAHIWKLRIIL